MGPFGKPRPPGWVQIEPIANGEGTDLAQICARSRFAARADAGPCARVGSARDREPDSPLRAYWSVYELTHRTPGARRAAGLRSTRMECPNLLAHYFNLWGTTVVWQAIETAWVSASQREPMPARHAFVAGSARSVMHRRGAIWGFGQTPAYLGSHGPT